MTEGEEKELSQPASRASIHARYQYEIHQNVSGGELVKLHAKAHLVPFTAVAHRLYSLSTLRNRWVRKRQGGHRGVYVVANKVEGQLNEQTAQALEECGRCGGASIFVHRWRHFLVSGTHGDGGGGVFVSCMTVVLRP